MKLKFDRTDVVLVVLAVILFVGTPGVPDEAIPLALIVLSKLIK